MESAFLDVFMTKVVQKLLGSFREFWKVIDKEAHLLQLSNTRSKRELAENNQLR